MFSFELDTEKTVAVIVSKDNAIKGTTDEAYEEYLKDLDETKLAISGEPTRFVLKKTLPYKDTKKVMNSQVSLEGKKPKVNISFIMDEVRCALVAIENSNIPLKKDSDGYCSADIVNALYNRGVLMDLYTARRNASGDNEEEIPKKS